MLFANSDISFFRALNIKGDNAAVFLIDNCFKARFTIYFVRSENDLEQKPTNKRLRWVSAMDKTQSNSLASSTTSNSR